MPITRTCGNCSKRYTITNVDANVTGTTERLDVRCPHCTTSEGTVIASAGTGQTIIVKAD